MFSFVSEINNYYLTQIRIFLLANSFRLAGLESDS